MIKRITDAAEFKELVLDIDEIASDDEVNAHAFLKHDSATIINCYANTHLLTWDFFVWANLNEHNKFDAIIAFVNHKNEKFGEEIFTEYIWLSKNPKVGYKLFATALKLAKEKEFKYIQMGRVMSHPKSDKVARFYERMGFVKDSESYIAKL